MEKPDDDVERSLEYFRQQVAAHGVPAEELLARFLLSVDQQRERDEGDAFEELELELLEFACLRLAQLAGEMRRERHLDETRANIELTLAKITDESIADRRRRLRNVARACAVAELMRLHEGEG